MFLSSYFVEFTASYSIEISMHFIEFQCIPSRFAVHFIENVDVFHREFRSSVIVLSMLGHCFVISGLHEHFVLFLFPSLVKFDFWPSGFGLWVFEVLSFCLSCFIEFLSPLFLFTSMPRLLLRLFLFLFLFLIVVLVLV